ncbi:uncharacterized protein [Watersipora subatra]|uniref:uncharacterized protein n=1 Tax=Watersipora subatra TaxID=2589382 RepID=UPI00355C6657
MFQVSSIVQHLQHAVPGRGLPVLYSRMIAYDQWPFKKHRRIGRRPNYYKGQGGKKSRIPYDKRYPLSGKDINDTVEGLKRGGNAEMMSMIGEERSKSNPAVIKYYDYVKEREMIETVPEMIPEFIVPSLANFKLKPYVSYSVDENDLDFVSPHSAEDLYKETYHKNELTVKNKFKDAATKNKM